jgi:L,D-transpeptidase ErfK/SrfK
MKRTERVIRHKTTVLLLLLISLGHPYQVSGSENGSRTSQLPQVVGEHRLTQIIGDETLMEVARREGVGYEVVANSNPAVNPWRPGSGTSILLPGEVILPKGAQPGLSINLAELRLFYIDKTKDNHRIDVYPLGIGRAGRETPEGSYHVIVKKEHPDWRVPAGLRELDPGLPQIMPPGPQNPLGDYWIGLSAPGYGVHGTNRSMGVGRRVSYGCLRMYPGDIARLYSQVEAGTPVKISYQPVKAAWSDGYLLLEVHPDYLERYSDLFQHALTVISQTGWPAEIDYKYVMEVVAEHRGLPEIVGSQATE